MERWLGRVALVTGASSGIGAAICVELVKQGMKVVGCARGVEKIVELGDKMPQGSLLAIRCDLTKEDEIESMFQEIRKKHGRVDVCVNCAGVSMNTSLLSGKTEDWKYTLDLNVLAMCICTREAIKLMREKKIDDGQIIQLSSVIGHKVVAGATFYSGTKYMVRALTEGLRQELKTANSNIRVASISPGAVKTDMLNRMYPGDTKTIETVAASLEFLEAEDIAGLVTSILQTQPKVNVNEIIVRHVALDL